MFVFIPPLESALFDGQIAPPFVHPVANRVISIGSQPEFASSLDRALQLVTSDMVTWLTKDHGIEPWAAHLLIGYQGSYDVVTVAGSMALKIPKKHLPPK